MQAEAWNTLVVRFALLCLGHFSVKICLFQEDKMHVEENWTQLAACSHIRRPWGGQYPDIWARTNDSLGLGMVWHRALLRCLIGMDFTKIVPHLAENKIQNTYLGPQSLLSPTSRISPHCPSLNFNLTSLSVFKTDKAISNAGSSPHRPSLPRTPHFWLFLSVHVSWKSPPQTRLPWPF